MPSLSSSEHRASSHHCAIFHSLSFRLSAQRRSLSSPTPVTANTRTLPSPFFALLTHTSEKWWNFRRENFPLSLKVFSVFVWRRWKTDEMSQLKQQPHRQHDKLSVISYDETKNESRFRSRVELSLHSARRAGSNDVKLMMSFADEARGRKRKRNATWPQSIFTPQILHNRLSKAEQKGKATESNWKL